MLNIGYVLPLHRCALIQLINRLCIIAVKKFKSFENGTNSENTLFPICSYSFLPELSNKFECKHLKT